jgi:hypothetical protein
MGLANQSGWYTSLMKLASNNLAISLFITSFLSWVKRWSHCLTGLAIKNRIFRDLPPWKGVQLGHIRDLDNPIWSKVFKNRMFRELPPSTSTQLSLTSLMMGLTMRGCRPSFSTKSGWLLRSKVMGTSYHLRYSGVAGETAMTSRAVSFCFLLDS